MGEMNERRPPGRVVQRLGNHRVFRGLRGLRRRLRRDGERGATMLEWVLLLAAIVLPSYVIIQLGLRLLFAHYQMVTTINGLPFP